MCGRYNIVPNADALMTAFGIIESRLGALATLHPRYNIAPSAPGTTNRGWTRVPIVCERNGRRELLAAVWPLIPPWERRVPPYATANARAESVADKPVFRDAWHRGRRALFPLSGYYEWQRRPGEQGKQPFHIFRKDRSLMAAAGVWQLSARGDDAPILSAAILTCPANALCAPIHDRMPVFVAPDDHAVWLTGAPHDAAALMRPFPAHLMTAEPISRRVNDPNCNDASILDPD